MSTNVSSPTPPPAPSASDSAKAWADAQPQIMEQQLKYAPIQAQQQLDLAQQYALPYAEIYRDAQAALYPETQALQEQYAQQAMQGSQQGLTDAERGQYMDYFKSNLGTNAGSGIGASYVANNMVQADQQRKDYYTNLGLSLSGRQPLTNPTTPQTADYMSAYTPNAVMGFDSQNYGNYSGAYSSMYGANASLKASQNQMYGQMASGAAGAIGMAMM